jgi:hypothetical protein
MEPFFDNEHRDEFHMQSVAANISEKEKQEMSHKKILRSEIRKSRRMFIRNEA